MMIAWTLSLALGAGTLLLPASVGSAQNSLPAVHHDPITIRILDGNGGAPLAHMHLQVAAGYDDRDLRLGLWSEEVVTDGQGRASLPGSLSNFSLVAVWVAKRKLCAAHGRSTYLNLDNIRYEGLNTPNLCGATVVAETPGVINVFAKARPEDLPHPPAPPAAKPPARCLCNAAKANQYAPVEPAPIEPTDAGAGRSGCRDAKPGVAVSR